MNQAEVEAFVAGLENVQREDNFGYAFFFVGDDHRLSFTTIANSDNEYDNVSNLNRDGVFRVNIGVSKKTFKSLIGEPGTEAVDYSVLNVFLPHPDYARQYYVCILNPSGENVETTKKLIVEAHSIAAARLQRKAKNETPTKGVNMTHPQPDGFLAVPTSGKGPGVLVLHAWWGLNETFKAVCTRLAEAGFVAFAPDLYHGKVVDTIADAEASVQALDANQQQAQADIANAIRFLSEHADDSGMAVIGFSMGAYYALGLAAADPEHIRSVVLFYGSGGGDFSRSKAAYLGHFAAQDEYEPQANLDYLEKALKDAGRPATFHVYPETGHWFFEPNRPDAYNPSAAALAWERTLDFLKR